MQLQTLLGTGDSVIDVPLRQEELKCKIVATSESDWHPILTVITDGAVIQDPSLVYVTLMELLYIYM